MRIEVYHEGMITKEDDDDDDLGCLLILLMLLVANDDLACRLCLNRLFPLWAALCVGDF